jgi:hypothetical protein
MTERVLGPTGSPRRRWTLLLPLVAVFAFGLLYIAGAGAVLTGSPSSFEANDGNMTIGGNTPPSLNGLADWNCFIGQTGFVSGTAPTCSSVNVSGAFAASDTAAATNDDSWKNGTKFDTSCAPTDGNKNQPKDDFTSVATYSEAAANNHTFLYGATIRYTANGNASENVELNTKEGTAACPIVRTAGDRLLAFDYLNGGTSLDLHVLTWIDSTNSTAGGNQGICNVKTNSMPCWGANVLTPSPTSFEGVANQAAITVAGNGISGQALVVGQFAEFGVDLTSVLDLNPSACTTFAQTVWESRASGSSFSSNPADLHIDSKDISNCGQITIIKQTNPRGQNQDFGFSSTIPNPVGTVTSDSSPYCQLDTTPNGTYTGSGTAGFKLNDNGNTSSNSAANTEDCLNVLKGTYTVTEGSDPSGYAFASVTCTGGQTGTTGTSTTNRTATIVLAPGDHVTCTYVNNQVTGAIVMTKTGKYKGCTTANSAITVSGSQIGVCGPTGSLTTAKLGGATLKISTDSAGNNVVSGAGSLTTSNTTGTVCFDGLALGTFYVTETAAPTGYKLNSSAAKTVSVSAGGTCNAAKTAIASGVSGVDTATSAAPVFSDTPLTNLSVSATSQQGNATNSLITCVITGTSTAIGNSPQGYSAAPTVTASGTGGLAPGNYTCTIDVDP